VAPGNARRLTEGAEITSGEFHQREPGIGTAEGEHMLDARRRHLLARGRQGLAVAAVGVLAAACASPVSGDGSSSAKGGDICADSEALAVVQGVEGLTGEERQTFLLEKAVKSADGAIDMYTEINDPGAITDAFEDLYEDLTVNVYRAGSEQIRQRVLEESSAGFSGADLIEMDTLEMAILDDEKLLAPLSSTYVDEVSEAAIFDNYIGDRLSYIVPVWNKNKLAASEAPTSLEDFADPRFKGKLALEGSDVFWFAGLVMHLEGEGMTRDEAVDLFRDIASNATITSGHTTTTELVAAGQYSIAINNFVHRALEMQGKKAPLEWAPVQIPVVAEITGTALHCAADNPAGALLLQDFILSADGGQKIFVEEGRTPANQKLAQDSLGGEQIEPIKVDVAEVAADYATWAELWDEVVRSGSAG
jgi:iron(III) transport system substrate-binding protein